MLELDFAEEIAQTEKPEPYLGMYKIPMDEYRKAEGLANSELQLFEVNPSNYIWNKLAPLDRKKASAADVGTILHTMILEPELYEDSVLISSTKGREAQTFTDFQEQNPDKIVLTESENKQTQLMSDSARCHPMFNKIIEAKGDCEASIFVDDPTTGLRLKIRVDKIIHGAEKPIFSDVKTSATLDEWRSDKEWINPLFKFNYGFTASFYLYVGSIFYGLELDTYLFPVVQKTSMLGRYPVSVFKVTKAELVEYGFWDGMLQTLNSFAKHKAEDNWLSFEYLPQFNTFDGDVEIKYEG